MILLENKKKHLNYSIQNIIKQDIKRNKKMIIIIKIVIIQKYKIFKQHKLIFKNINYNKIECHK